MLNKARKSISKFCIDECHAYCCRKGYLVLTEKEAKLITKKENLIESKNIKKLDNGNYSLYLGGIGMPCPSLKKEFECGIHDKRARPKTCKDFPIFVLDEKTVKFSSRCLAVKLNMFYPYVKKLISEGYTVIEGDIDSDFYDIV